MRVVQVARPNGDHPEYVYLNKVVTDLARIASQGARVYRTYVKNDRLGANWVLGTTSKDVHLFIGAMSREGQQDLCRLLEQEFSNGECAELLLREEITSGKRNTIRAVRHSQIGADLFFDLSPAH